MVVFNEYDERPKRVIIGTASRNPYHSFAVVPRGIKESVPIGGIIGDGKYVLQNTLRLTSTYRIPRGGNFHKHHRKIGTYLFC